MKLNLSAINYLPRELLEKINVIKELLSGKRVLVLLSGGVDSSLVLILAKIYAQEVIAFTSRAVIYDEDVINRAKDLAKSLGVLHVIRERDIFKIRELVVNDDYRCYYCKKDMVRGLWSIVKEFKIDLVVDGTNYDDLSDNRMGLKALREYKVVSPLALAEISKKEVRFIAKTLGLSYYDAPPESCYIMRVMKGIKLSPEIINRIKQAEKIVMEILGAKLVRVRDHGDLARIELLPEDFYELDIKKLPIIAKELKKLGYNKVTLDLSGYHDSILQQLTEEKA